MSIKDIPIQEVPIVKRGRGRPKKNNGLTIAKSEVLDAPKDLNKAGELLRASGALFDTLDSDIYRARLDSFSLNELTNEAFRVGLKGGQDRTNTTRAILEVFQDYRNKFVPNYLGVGQKDGLSDDKRTKALELMKDGR